MTEQLPTLDDIKEYVKDGKRHLSNLEIRLHESGLHIPRELYWALTGLRESLTNIELKLMDVENEDD